MANGDENAVGFHLMRLTRLGVFNARAGDAERVFITENFINRAVPQHIDFLMRQQTLFENFLAAQRIAAMHQRHFAGKIGQE